MTHHRTSARVRLQFFVCCAAIVAERTRSRRRARRTRSRGSTRRAWSRPRSHASSPRASHPLTRNATPRRSRAPSSRSPRPLAKRRNDVAHRRRGLAANRHEERADRFERISVRSFSRERLVEDDASDHEVGSVIDVLRAQHLFGRHVKRRAEQDARGRERAILRRRELLLSRARCRKSKIFTTTSPVSLMASRRAEECSRV